jgi:hypothetical protein
MILFKLSESKNGDELTLFDQFGNMVNYVDFEAESFVWSMFGEDLDLNYLLHISYTSSFYCFRILYHRCSFAGKFADGKNFTLVARPESYKGRHLASISFSFAHF